MQSLIKISVIIPTHNRPELVKRAIESYLKAIDLNPQDANAYNNLGSTYSDQKEYSKAIDCYLKADYSRAIECYLKAIKLDPQYANAYNNLGSTYSAQEDYSRAIDCYLKAVELNPQDATAYNNLGSTYSA